MNKKLLMSFVFVLALVFQVLAQDRAITGKVTSSEDGSPLPGVNIGVKGTSRGTTTDANGNYKINASGNAVLTFSFVGFNSYSVNAGSRTVIDVKLVNNNQELEEVVVTALGIEKSKRELNYATQNVKGSDLAQKSEPNVLNALQGRVAGVQITGASGEAGASTNINIRGITSFTGNNQPLFVVDGIPVSNDLDRTNGGPNGTLGGPQSSNRALDIAPENIESINILKGPAAAALYGSRASSGAVIITTKSGKGGSLNKKMEVTVSSSYTVQNMYGYPELQNDYGQGSAGIYLGTTTNSWGPKFGTTPTLANGLLKADGTTVPYKAYPNNNNDFYKQGSIASNSVNLAGGNATQSYSMTLGNTTQKGIIPGSEFNRTNVAFGGTTLLANKIKFGGSFNYTLTGQNNFLTGNGASAPGVLSSLPRSYDLQGLPYKDANGRSIYITSNDNPYWSVENNKTTSTVDRITGNINLGYDITPWMSVTYRLGLDNYTDRRKQVFAIGAARLPTGAILEDVFYRNEINSDLIFRFKKDKLFSDDINFTGLIGYNVNQRKFQNVSAYGGGLTLPNYYNINNATTYTSANGATGESNTLRRLIGYYAQASFDYKNYLFLELTGRADQSSTLPKDNNTFFYPSASLGFSLTDAFKMESDILSFAKLRVSYAKVGKDADPYKLASVYTVTSQGNNVSSISFPINGQAGFSIGTRIGSGNNLTPEFTTSYEAGGNFGFFRNRMNLDLAVYQTISTDQILDVAVAGSTGYSTRTTNIGKMTNKGLEVMLSYKVITGKNFDWTVTGNLTMNRNKVDEIGNGVTSFSVPGSAFTGSVPSIVEGRPYGVILGNKRVRNADGKFVINPVTGFWVAATPNQEISNPNPDAIIGISNSFKYKGVGFSFLIDSQQGGSIVSFTAATLKGVGALKETAVDRDKPRIIDGVILNSDGTYRPNNIQIDAQNYWSQQGTQTDLNVYGATTYRLREVVLSYQLPKSVLAKLPFGDVNISLTGRNLFFIAPDSPIDPELNTQGAGNIRGLELQSAPNTRNYGVNVRLTF
ncbi:SusC/RagA family TonB-linked outer membrane protein [Pseudarcicella hirudinis]|nr:SusC/RagA family TonB-linked outer membrane protein [Pseudarcicella hirudinis]